MEDALDFLKTRIRDGALIRSDDHHRIISRSSEVPSAWIFDFRAILFEPGILKRYAELFWERYASAYPFQVAGPETVGIALMTAIIMEGTMRGTPVNGLFIRKSRKKDGLMKFIEGTSTADPVIVVDDIINSGQTLNKQIAVLADHGLTAAHAFTILAFRAREAYSYLESKHVRLASLFLLTDFDLPLFSNVAAEVPQNAYDIRWRFAAGHPAFQYVVQKSAPVIHGRAVYMGSDDGFMWSLDKASGDVMWNFRIGPHPLGKGIFSTPLIVDGVVYFGAYDGYVYALDAVSGEKKWATSVSDWVGSSPCVNSRDGLLYVGLEFGLWGKKGGIAALRLSDGSVAWESQSSDFTHSSPLYISEERAVVVGNNNGMVYCLDASTGRERWRFQSGGDVKAGFAYDLRRRLVLFGSYDASLYAVSIIDGSCVFEYKTGASIFSTPCLSDDRAYVTSLDKHCYAIDLETGKEVWRFNLAGRCFATPVLCNGSIVVGSNSGRLYVLDARTGNLRSFFQTAERIVNAVAVDGSMLYVPTVGNELYCIQKKR